MFIGDFKILFSSFIQSHLQLDYLLILLLHNLVCLLIFSSLFLILLHQTLDPLLLLFHGFLVGSDISLEANNVLSLL